MYRRQPLLHSLIRTTIAPVIMNGGFRMNVIPGSAEVTLNVRLIPGTDTNAIAQPLAKPFNPPLRTGKRPEKHPVGWGGHAEWGAGVDTCRITPSLL